MVVWSRNSSGLRASSLYFRSISRNSKTRKRVLFSRTISFRLRWEMVRGSAAYLTMFLCWISLSSAISRMAKLGTPSFSILG